MRATGMTRASALLAVTLTGAVSTLPAQVPSRIPSDLEAQVFNLIQRVTALEQKLAGLTNGTTSMRVRAPFQVLDAAGQPILQVVEDGAGARKAAGILVSASTASGYASLSLLDKAGSPRIDLANLAKETGIALYDERSELRAGFGLDGVIETFDESGKPILIVGPDVSQSDAAIRLGKDEDGMAVAVGPGPDVARLGRDDEGGGQLTISDLQGNARANISGEGTLQIWDSSDKGLLTVAEDVSGDNASVTIGGEDDGTRIKIASSKSVIMGTDGGVAGFAAYQGGRPLSSLTLTETGSHLNLANGGGTTVVSLEVSPAGNGRFQLGGSDGQATVEAGVTTDGLGVVRAYPLGNPGAGLVGMPGTFILGRSGKN